MIFEYLNIFDIISNKGKITGQLSKMATKTPAKHLLLCWEEEILPPSTSLTVAGPRVVDSFLWSNNLQQKLEIKRKLRWLLPFIVTFPDKNGDVL